MSQASTSAQRRPTNRVETQPKPDTSRGINGRLPKAPSPLLGPFKRFSSNYQLNRAQKYHDEGGEYVDEIGNAYQEWKSRQEYAQLVQDGREVLEYMDDMLDRDSWPVTESRDIKHVARRYRTSALRSSLKAKQERREEGVSYVPDTSSTPAEQGSGQASLQVNYNTREGWYESRPPPATTLAGGTVFTQPLPAGPAT